MVKWRFMADWTWLERVFAYCITSDRKLLLFPQCQPLAAQQNPTQISFNIGLMACVSVKTE